MKTSINKAIPKTIVQKLKGNIPFFSNFTDEEMFELLQLSIRKEFQADEVIFLENSEGNEMYVILSGNVKITKKTVDNKDIVLASLTSGDCFGEMSMIDGSNRSAKAEAAESLVVLLALQEDVLTTNLNLAYKLFKNFSVLMANRLRVTNKSFADKASEESKNLTRFSEIVKKYAEKGGSFENANLRSSNLVGISFSKSDMKGSLFVGSELKEGRINNSNFELASFVGSKFNNTMFSDCKFSGSNFSASMFDKVIFKNCRFDDLTVQQLQSRGVVIHERQKS